MRIRSILAATALVAAGTLSALSAPVQASPLDCPDPYWRGDPSSYIHPRTLTSVQLKGRSIELRTGYTERGGVWMAWAKMSKARALDRIWLDISRDGGQTWEQCGPFHARKRQYTPGEELDAVAVRACGDVRDTPFHDTTHRCTSWWSA